MSKIEQGEFDKDEDFAGIFDVGKNIGHNSPMQREISVATPAVGALVLISHVLQNAYYKRPHYHQLLTRGLPKVGLTMLLIESIRTINFKRYTRRHKMVELYYEQHKDELPHIGPGPKKYCESVGDWNCTRF